MTKTQRQKLSVPFHLLNKEEIRQCWYQGKLLITAGYLLTIKKVADWNSVLGLILPYSGFYPEPQKRIHRFGSASELRKLADIEAACLVFGVKVTGEEV